MFIWHGSDTSPLVRAHTHCKAIELEDMLRRAKDASLQLLFSGAVVRNAKLQKGVIIPIGSLGDEDNLAKIVTLVKNNYLINYLSETRPTDKVRALLEQVSNEINKRKYQSNYSNLD